MSKVLWFLNRAAAGVLAAATTGVLVDVIFAMFEVIVTPDSRANLGNSLLFGTVYGALFGAALGGVPGILVMCMSRAQLAPWRSLPILIVGTSLGVFASLLAISIINRYTTLLDYWPLVVTTATATIGGVIASFFLPKRKAISLDSVS